LGDRGHPGGGEECAADCEREGEGVEQRQGWAKAQEPAHAECRRQRAAQRLHRKHEPPRGQAIEHHPGDEAAHEASADRRDGDARSGECRASRIEHIPEQGEVVEGIAEARDSLAEPEGGKGTVAEDGAVGGRAGVGAHRALLSAFTANNNAAPPGPAVGTRCVR
jgi:hypothetical protein